VASDESCAGPRPVPRLPACSFHRGCRRDSSSGGVVASRKGAVVRWT
jgi:hypothetical protein